MYKNRRIINKQFVNYSPLSRVTIMLVITNTKSRVYLKKPKFVIFVDFVTFLYLVLINNFFFCKILLRKKYPLNDEYTNTRKVIPR